MSRALRILIVDDSPDDAGLIHRRLEEEGFAVEMTRVQSREEMAAQLKDSTWDIVLSDHSLPGFSSTGALAVRDELAARIPVIIVSGAIGEEAAVQTLQAGAADYVLKDNLERLGPSVTRVLRETEAQRQLTRMKGRTDLILDAAAEGIFGIDSDGHVTFVNPAATTLLGHRADELIGMPIESLVGGGEPPVETDPVRRTLATGETHTVGDAFFRHRDGDLFPVKYMSSPISEEGEITGAVVVFGDVTEQRQAEAAQQRLTAILEATTDLVAIADVDGTETTSMLLNPAGRHLLGLPEAESPGMTPAPPDLIATLTPPEAIRAATRDGVWTGEHIVQAPSGPLPVSEVVIAHRDADRDVAYVSVIARDISDRKRFEAELSYLADHDTLTGLFNRRRFRTEVERQLDYSRRYGDSGAVIVVDLDNFKKVNDTHGHDAGSSLLRSVSELLHERLRTSDVLARLGSDEFAVLLPNAEADEARAVADDVIRLIRERITIGNDRVGSLTASAGVALFGDEDLGADELLVHADRAMYQAKDAGRNTLVVFTPAEARQARARSRHAWEARIRAALDEERFVLHLQPIVELGTRRVAAYEALLRMVEEDGELVPPGAFLLAAERFGLINSIDRMVVRRTTELLASFPDETTRLEVNLSGQSVGDAEILSLIQAEVARHGIAPGRLVFEVTETAAIANVGLAAAFARDLSALGCQFALDDFGVGFGSFYYLKHLPLDFLKIDGEFIRGLPERPADQVMVRAMAEVASSLGKQTIAEFVGDDPTVELLRSYGVELGQGFHLGKPAPADTVLATMERAASPPT